MATTDLSFYQEWHEGRYDSFFAAEMDGGLWVCMVRESGVRQSAAYELFPLHYCFDSGKQFILSIRLNHVTVPITESYPRHFYINLLTQEKYFGFGSNSANPSGRFNPIQSWQSNVQ